MTAIGNRVMTNENSKCEKCGTIEEFSVVLSNKDAVCKPGGYVSGHVTFRTQKAAYIHGVYLKYYGGCFVKWKAEDDEISSEQATLFDHTVCLWDEESFPLGRHSFPFQVKLPKSLPPSFEGKCGWIKYYCQASVSVANNSIIRRARAFFTVVHEVDLSQAAEKTTPVLLQKTIAFGNMRRKPERIDCAIFMPKLGYVSGETVYAHLRLNSGSSLKRVTSKALLRRTVRYGGQSDVRCEPKEKQLVEHLLEERGRLSTSDQMLLMEFNLKIPPVVPAFSSALIIVEYELLFTISNVYGSAYTMEVPLVVGTKPTVATSVRRFTYAAETPPSKELIRGSKKLSKFVTSSPSDPNLPLNCTVTAFKPVYPYYLEEVGAVSLDALACSPGMKRRRVMMLEKYRLSESNI